MPRSPGDILREALGEAALRHWADLDGWLDAQLAGAKAAWPQLELDEAVLARFAAALRRRTPEATAKLRGADLLLASACVLQRPAALAAIDPLVRDEVRRAVTALDPMLVDDVLQQVREKLFVGEGARIAEYSGDGPLGAWLRAVSVRLALNARRQGGREVPQSSLPELPLADPDPELALLRQRYRDSFRSAFAEAIASLSPRERTVLKLHTLDGLTLARIGAMYRKDLSTISRWLEQIRKTLLERTRERLGATLALETAALESLMRVADSELSVSLARLLESVIVPAEDGPA